MKPELPPEFPEEWFGEDPLAQKKRLVDRFFEETRAAFRDGVLGVYIPEPVPGRRAVSRLGVELKLCWKHAVAHAVESLKVTGRVPLPIVPASVLIVACVPEGKWDVDNVAYRLIVNGLVAAGVLPDDSTQYLDSVTVRRGRPEPRPHTEVYVTSPPLWLATIPAVFADVWKS
ncbi:hypothetical protein Adeg_0815 [Ammonifex degensii KC4]|uniref:Uncharacterized protein n=1 Tax=Ammonifex degensii (strain DSM 10501 / KC4) TaxID=429009 RepID=C9RCI0_AMMDK|nr:hypothetical protein [Ammonifex degensii]ACX51957.1 hypothetical protein Adeg_0815 [Ammonifex degensii KC4]